MVSSDFELTVTPENAHAFKAGIVLASGFIFLLMTGAQSGVRNMTIDIGLPDAIQNYMTVMLFIFGFGLWFWVAFYMVDSSAKKHRLDQEQADALLEDDDDPHLSQ